MMRQSALRSGAVSRRYCGIEVVAMPEDHSKIEQAVDLMKQCSGYDELQVRTSLHLIICCDHKIADTLPRMNTYCVNRRLLQDAGVEWLAGTLAAAVFLLQKQEAAGKVFSSVSQQKRTQWRSESEKLQKSVMVQLGARFLHAY